MSMGYDDVVLGRRSIRGYQQKPVPKEVIEEILILAMRSPSSLNSQPWNFTVLTGAQLDKIRAGNTERNLAGVPHSREFRIGKAFEGQHRERQVGVAKQLFAAMGIAREDAEARRRHAGAVGRGEAARRHGVQQGAGGGAAGGVQADPGAAAAARARLRADAPVRRGERGGGAAPTGSCSCRSR